MNIRTLRLICLCCIFFVLSISSAFAVTLDQTFGNDGRVAVELGVYGERANAVAVQPDGKIVVAGSSSNAADHDFMLFRLLADGSLDPDFNYDGTVTTAVGSGDDEALALVLQDDGKILAVGYSSNESDRDFALVRYNSDGSLDRNFGEEGIVVTPVGNSDDEITGVALQEDGAAIVTGSAKGTTGRVLVLARYLDDGSLDKDFAEQGFSFTGVGDDAQAESVAIQKDQKLVVSGSYVEGEKLGMMVVGFDENGLLDEDFGQYGIAISADGTMQSEGYGMIIRKDGAILVAGSVGIDGERDAALFQFTDDGKVDKEFDKDGVLVTSVGPDDDVLYDVIEIESGIAASGYAAKENVKEFLLINYTDSGVTVKKDLLRKEKKVEEDSPAWLRISELFVEDSFTEMQEEDHLGELKAEVLTTAFTDDEDFATALAARGDSGIVTVGIMSTGDIPHAGISSYSLQQNQNSEDEADDPRALTKGSQSIITGEPYEVTRTTAVIPVTIYSDLGTVTERGIVFSTYPNPTVGGVAASDKKKENPGDEPILTNLLPSGNVKPADKITLQVTTNVAATCKWSVTPGTEFKDMDNTFETTGRTNHSHSLSNLKIRSAPYKYYVRCQDAAGTANSKDAIISFTVNSFAESVFSHSSLQDVISRPLESIGGFFVSSAYAAVGDEALPGDSATTAQDSKGKDSAFFQAQKDGFSEEGRLKEGGGTGTFTAKLDNLKPGSFFYARAYAIVEGKTYYGNTVGFRTSDSCFIATAAFGSVFHPTVHLLREFRDSFMLTNSVGRFFVRQYYHFSPPIADVIATDSLLRFIVRVLLLPLIGLAWLALQLGTVKSVVLLVVGVGWMVHVCKSAFMLRSV